MRNSSYKNKDDARFEENIDQAFNLPFDAKLGPVNGRGNTHGRNKHMINSWDGGPQFPTGIL